MIDGQSDPRQIASESCREMLKIWRHQAASTLRTVIKLSIQVVRGKGEISLEINRELWKSFAKRVFFGDYFLKEVVPGMIVLLYLLPNRRVDVRPLAKMRGLGYLTEQNPWQARLFFLRSLRVVDVKVAVLAYNYCPRMQHFLKRAVVSLRPYLTEPTQNLALP